MIRLSGLIIILTLFVASCKKNNIVQLDQCSSLISSFIGIQYRDSLATDPRDTSYLWIFYDGRNRVTTKKSVDKRADTLTVSYQYNNLDELSSITTKSSIWDAIDEYRTTGNTTEMLSYNDGELYFTTIIQKNIDSFDLVITKIRTSDSVTFVEYYDVVESEMKIHQYSPGNPPAHVRTESYMKHKNARCINELNRIRTEQFFMPDIVSEWLIVSDSTSSSVFNYYYTFDSKGNMIERSQTDEDTHAWIQYRYN